MPDTMDVPGWAEFLAARQRFLDGLAADSARRRTGPRRPSGRPFPLAAWPAAEQRGEPPKLAQGQAAR
jgi:hypothetical protein